MPMTEKERHERILRQEAARLVTREARAALNGCGVRLEKRGVGRAIHPSVRKKVSGKRIAYYKPRFVKVGDEYKYARKHDGNASYTVVDPEAITRVCKQRCLRKYRAWLRKVHACQKTDSIVFTWGLSAKDRHDYNRELKRVKYMR